MKIAFFLSSLGGSPLQVGLDRGLSSLGHVVEEYRAGESYDLVLIFNQSAHTTRYVYPTFPSERNLRFAFIDTAEYGYGTRYTPSIRRRFATSFTPDCMNHDTKSSCEQWRLRNFLEGRSFPYFLREMFKEIQYPTGYSPIDYSLYAYSECNRRPSRDEYMMRQEDLFCSWGSSHPFRLDITRHLRAHPCKKTVLVLEENGTPRMIQSEYFARTEAAKCSVSFDGYGSGSFRICEVLARTVLLQGPLSIVLRDPLVDGVTCIEYQVESDGENFISTNIGEKLQWILDRPDEAFQVYANGFEHVNSKWTERATAQYVLNIVEKHPWHLPTPLEVV